MTSKKQRCENLYKSLCDEKKRWEPKWKDIRDNVYPYLGSFDDENINDSESHDEMFYNSITIKFAAIFAAGLMSGVSSPTRPWVKLMVKNNAQVMQDTDVLKWLEVCKDITLSILTKGKFYSEAHKCYLEVGVFCTLAMFIEEDMETVAHCHAFTIGEFAVGTDAKGKYNQFCRTLKMTASQLVDKFGEENIPSEILREYKGGNSNNLTMPYKVKHLICPNPDYNEKKMDSFKYSDYYWMDCNGQKDAFLKEGGFRTFPVMVTPYLKKGSDVYGTGPGFWSLADAKQNHMMNKDATIAVEQGVNPPLQAGANTIQGAGINSLPSGITYYNPVEGAQGVKALFETKLDVNGVVALMDRLEEREKEHFCVKIFQLLTDMDRGTRTATEVTELIAEKMSQLGPLLENLHDFLSQVIERILDIGFRNNVFPPAPEALQGRELDVEFISTLALAQKQQSLTPITNVVQGAISMATSTQDMSILDKIDFDEVIDQTAELNGSPPSIVRSDKLVAQIRQQRQQAQQAAAQAQNAAALVNSAKTASQADMSGDNALTRLVGAQ